MIIQAKDGNFLCSRSISNGMKQSELFTKTRREAPKDEVSKNAELLIRAGFINKEMAGVYSYLPLGLRVLKKIEEVIRKEMNALGGQELLLSAFHPKENWERTGRWESMDDLYKVADASGREIALGPTHEEIVVPLVKQFISSYKDLPFAVYQFQTKFRMELRAKSGLLRGREFSMKDLYSFHATEKDFKAYYEQVKQAYRSIFDQMGIGESTYLTFATGGTFSKYSHEFQTLSSVGEDTIHLCESCGIAVNNEIIKEQKVCPECGNEKLKKEKAIEVGNIFDLKTKFSDAFSLTYKDGDGKEQPVLMGCYGLGPSRLLGTVVEVLGDKKGIVWPKSIAPFALHLVLLDGSSGAVRKYGDMLYATLHEEGIEVLYDDRDTQAGEKFAASDLIGIPHRAVVSARTLEAGTIELTERATGKTKMVSEEELKFKV